MKGITAIALTLLGLGCADKTDDKTESTSTSTPEVPLSDAEHTARSIVGTWAAEKIEVVFLDGEDNFVSIPTNVYPDRYTELVFTDGTPNRWLKLISEISFYSDGTMYNHREFLWDADQDGQPDRSSYAEETLGEWSAKSSSVVMDTEDFYVESLIDFLTEDELYMVWDRDDPLFMDDSCVFTMNVRRQAASTVQ
mgnify:CR=1 FL=1